MLLDKGADVNAKLTLWGHTALTAACRMGNRDVVEVLLRRGADIEAATTGGGNALWYAVNYGRHDVATLLIPTWGSY